MADAPEPLRVQLEAHIHPLDEGTPEWCDEHLLSDRLVQHWVVELALRCQGEVGAVVPHEVVRVEIHDGRIV